jgi:hypothetical protein
MGDKKKKRVVKDENFICIFGWMVDPDKLNLSGMELNIYAIIYGFSQTQDQYFTGSLQYLIEWTNSSRRAVINNLNSLVDKGLIIKEEVSYNKYRYKAVVQNVHHENDGAECAPDGAENAPDNAKNGAECAPDGAECAPNNIDNNINIYSSNKRENKTTQIKHKYGEYQNVLLKDNELKTLVVIYGQEKIDACIKELDEYIEMKGYKAKSHYLAIRKWVIDRVEEIEKKKSLQNSEAKKTQFNNFSQRHDTDFDALEKKMTGGTG